MRILAVVIVVIGLLVLGNARDSVAKEQFSYFRAIGSPAGARSAEPFLFVAPDGIVYLSWIEQTGENAHRMRLSTLDGEGWSAPVTITEGTDWFVNWADVPSVTASGDGRVAAHWLQKNGVGTYSYGVRISQSADGGRTWGEPTIPHTAGTEAEHGFVAMRYVGEELFAAWLDGGKFVGEEPVKEMTVRAARIARDGSVGAVINVDDRACDCCPMDIAIAGDRLILAYRDRSSDEIRNIRLAEFDARGEAMRRTRTLFDDHWQIAGCPVNGPALDAHGNDVFAAWFTMADESPVVKSATVDASTGTAHAPVRVDDGDAIGRVDLVALGDGLVLVCWIEAAGDGAEIRIRQVRTDGWIGASELVVATSAARSSGYPRIVRSGNRIIAAWTDASEPSRVRTASALISQLTRKL